MNAPMHLKEVFAKCKFFVTGDVKDYHMIMKAKSPRFLQIWNLVASWCNENSINGRAYVEWCFATEYPSYPQPSKFCTRFKQDGYLRHGCPDPQYDLTKLRFQLMIEKLNNKPEQLDVVGYLLDDLNEFDSVFIYTVAKNMGRQDELPPAILLQARQRVFCHPVYAERFNDFIPEELIAHGLKPSYN